MQIEYTKQTIENCIEQSNTNYTESYSTLINIEKYSRNHEKLDLLVESVTALLTIAKQHKTIDDIISVFTFILTRRAQQKPAITKAVELCVEYINEFKLSDKQSYEKLCKTVCSQTEGKVFVDLQRARIVKKYSLYLEENGRLQEAMELMKTMHIETFVSLDRMERMDFLLLQIRIALECEDYLQAQLLSNKINKNTIQTDGFEALRIEYCRLMIKYYLHNESYIDCTRCFINIYDTLTSLNESNSEMKMEITQNEWFRKEPYCIDTTYALKLSVFFLMTSEYVPEKREMLYKINALRELETHGAYHSAIQMFLTDELIESAQVLMMLKQMYEVECYPLIQIDSNEIAKHIRLQIIQHNIRVIAKYYHSITLKRFAELLDISIDELEQQICLLVNTKQIYAKIDRPNGTVSLVKTKDPKDVLNNWSSDIQQLLTLVNDTCFLIETEKMVHLK